MAATAIKIHDLAKEYQLLGPDKRHHRYRTLRDTIADAAKAPFVQAGRALRGERGPPRPKKDRFWALDGVSFDIKAGEVVGLIGRNGAGKSTLLKILSRIVEPTRGRAEIRGRIGSLLEVGTGFHPELTGRENIYLNGAILGMRRAEINRKFDEIVAFAEVERFLDTPVKRYSSGMYVRLAFAVAAHLEPEILIVDEVLAVGDAEFQKKCLGKMQDVAGGGGGRTVLFVSHSMDAVSTICSRGLLFDRGKIAFSGSAPDAVAQYLSGIDATGTSMIWQGPAPGGDEPVQVQHARVVSEAATRLVTHEPILVELELEVREPVRDLIVAWELSSSNGQLLAYTAMDDDLPPPGVTTAPGVYRLALQIPPDTLAAGSYRLCLDVGIHNGKRIVPEGFVRLQFEVDNIRGVGRRYSNRINLFRPRWNWLVTSNAQNSATVA
jgi:lipopolysaccharide transport system ATP-binding protein